MNRLQSSSLAFLGGVSLGLYGVCALLPACGASESRLLSATTSWVGNSFGGGKRWVQQDIQAMVVTEDGTVYCNIPWDEAGREAGIYKDGNVIGIAQHTHGWGYDGGSAIALNQRYLFIGQRVGNEGGNLNGTNTWPAKGLSWYGVSRRLRADVTRGAPFSGGKGDQGDTLKGCFLVVIEAPEKAEGGIAGLCADEHRLYVSCPGANEIGGIPGCTSSRPAPGCGACRATGSCSSMTCIQRRSRPIASIRPGPEESPCPRSSSPRATSRSRTRPGRPANPTKENGFGGTAMGTAPLIRPSI